LSHHLTRSAKGAALAPGCHRAAGPDPGLAAVRAAHALDPIHLCPHVWHTGMGPPPRPFGAQPCAGMFSASHRAPGAAPSVGRAARCAHPDPNPLLCHVATVPGRLCQLTPPFSFPFADDSLYESPEPIFTSNNSCCSLAVPRAVLVAAPVFWTLLGS